MRVRVADGPPQRIGTMGAQHLPGEDIWLIGEHRSTGERKYYLSNLSPDTSLNLQPPDHKCIKRGSAISRG